MRQEDQKVKVVLCKPEVSLSHIRSFYKQTKNQKPYIQNRSVRINAIY